jgi:hypothetical protein
MDYCQDVVDVEVHRLQKMDYCQDEELRVLLELEVLLALSVWNLHEQSLLESQPEQQQHLPPPLRVML